MRFVLFLLFVFPSFLISQPKTENVILITLDGLRWQELFSGADSTYLKEPHVSNPDDLFKKFWSDDYKTRRELLMPFMWSKIVNEGQILGNRKENCFVNVTNNMWFSYPGYQEILAGFADDENIDSNNKINNPNTTVLEFLNRIPSFKDRVAAFTSWDVFPFIINEERSGVYVSGGNEKNLSHNLTPNEHMLNDLMFTLPNPFGDSIRLDALTFNFAFEYLKMNRPRVLYIAFDETDDFAHQGKYDAYLNSAHYTDGFIQTLWSWIQREPQYKDKTTLLITTDHGRGTTTETWHGHGTSIPRTDEIWIAALGPDTPPTGECKESKQFYQNQVAATLTSFLSINFDTSPKIGKPIERLRMTD